MSVFRSQPPIEDASIILGDSPIMIILLLSRSAIVVVAVVVVFDRFAGSAASIPD